MTRFLLFLFIAVILGTPACKEADDCCDPPPAAPNGVFVLCEGQFGKGDAGIYFIDTLTDTTSDELFQAANNIPLGDIAQSIFPAGEFNFVVVNNSSRIEVVDDDLKLLHTIEDITSPRYIARIDDHTWAVSSYFNHAIYIISNQLGTWKVEQEITLPTSLTEELVYADSKLFVTAPRSYQGPLSTQLYVIQLGNTITLDSITVHNNPSRIKKLSDGNLVLLSADDFSGTGVTSGALQFINLNSLAVTHTYLLPSQDPSFGNYLAVNDNDEVFIGRGSKIYQGSKSSDPFNNPLTNISDEPIYGLAIDKNDQSIWVPTSPSFSQTGNVWHYYKENQRLQSKKYSAGGIGPNGVYWLHSD